MGVQTTAVIFSILLIGTLAFPQPIDDLSQFFDHTDRSARIVGGDAAAAGSVPYMVGLTTGTFITSFVCGASLVTLRTVLTAAHCIVAVSSAGQLNASLRGVAGTNQWFSGGQIIEFERHVNHENYVSSTIKNDIGILITRQNVQLSSLVSTVPLSFNWIDGGVPARAAGWGRIVQGGSLSSTLLELNVQTIDGNTCITEVARAAAEANMISPPIDPSIEICTYHAPGHGMCNGDSGSALVDLRNGQQIALVSWGIPCARGAPDMFVRISAYQDWINQHIV